MIGRRALCLAALAALGWLTGCATRTWDPGAPESVLGERLLAALALAPGAHVADVGAGRGELPFRLADAVGREGVVYAVDAEPSVVAHLRERVRREGRTNVVVVEAAPDDPRLPDASVDLALVVGAYHRLASRTTYFERVRRALRPDGRVAIAEVTESDLFGSPATPVEAIQNELRAAGYTLTAKHDLPERHSLLIFTPSP